MPQVTDRAASGQAMDRAIAYANVVNLANKLFTFNDLHPGLVDAV